MRERNVASDRLGYGKMLALPGPSSEHPVAFGGEVAERALLCRSANGAGTDSTQLRHRLFGARAASDAMRGEHRSCASLAHQAMHDDTTTLRPLEVDEIKRHAQLQR